jgi:hypothetical protein
MAQDPWKRAYELSKLAPQQPQAEAPQPQRRWPLVLGLIVVMLCLASLGAYLLGYVPLGKDASGPPETLAQTLPVLPGIRPGPIELDVDFIDTGLGIGLALHEDYLDLLSATRDWGVPWEVKTTSPATLRVTAHGVTVFVRDGMIETFELDLQEIYDGGPAGKPEMWKAWVPELQQAGLIPGTDYERYAGTGGGSEQSMKYVHGRRTVQSTTGWVHPVYALTFVRSKLRGFKGGQKFGPEADKPAAGNEAGKTSAGAE